MNNIVTFETARKLKEAGFPQPLPAKGQIWYDANGHEEMLWLIGDRVESDWVFAPTATDILEAMDVPEITFLHKGNKRLWVCENLGTPKVHPNPAEAAALAYLAIQKPQP